MLRRRWLGELWRNFLVASGSREVWESNGSILILAIPSNETSMVSTEFHLMCGRRPAIGMGVLIGDDKQKANQALAVQLRQLRFDGVDPIQELRLHIPWLGHSSFTASMQFLKGSWLTSTTPVRGKREDGDLAFAAPLFAATEAELGGLVAE